MGQLESIQAISEGERDLLEMTYMPVLSYLTVHNAGWRLWHRGQKVGQI